MNTVAKCAALLRSKKLSCLELLEATISGIQSGDHFQSFITPLWEMARVRARQLDDELNAGHDRGPFHGIPIAHKDNYYTKCVRTTAGSLVFESFVPEYDADVVARFHEAGAVCVGKTNLHELAFGITSKNPHYGSVLNPRDTTRIAGGSSGGSAALVAAGLLPFATGSDTGGSIRVPASYCGIVGLKPTYGRVSRRGLLPLSFSLDCAGPLANTAEDCALAMGVMTGQDFRLKEIPALKGMRIGLPSPFFERLDNRVSRRIQEVIELIRSQGARVSDISTPSLDELNAVARLVQMGETSALYVNETDPTKFGADVWSLLQQGKSIAAHEYVNAQRMRTLFRARLDEIWQRVDFLMMPTTPVVAPLLSEDTVMVGDKPMDVRLATTSLVRSWNLTGEPAISIPCPGNPGELPLGLQIVAAPFRDRQLLQFAQGLQVLFG